MDYQIDLQTAVNVPLIETWDFLFSKQGLDIWLGTWKLDKWETGITFISKNGVKGKIRVFNPYSHIRLSWKGKDWIYKSIVQLRTVSSDEKTIIEIHHEQIADGHQKVVMEIYWKKVLEKLSSILNSS